MQKKIVRKHLRNIQKQQMKIFHIFCFPCPIPFFCKLQSAMCMMHCSAVTCSCNLIEAAVTAVLQADSSQSNHAVQDEL